MPSVDEELAAINARLAALDSESPSMEAAPTPTPVAPSGSSRTGQSYTGDYEFGADMLPKGKSGNKDLFDYTGDVLTAIGNAPSAIGQGLQSAGQRYLDKTRFDSPMLMGADMLQPRKVFGGMATTAAEAIGPENIATAMVEGLPYMAKTSPQGALASGVYYAGKAAASSLLGEGFDAFSNYLKGTSSLKSERDISSRFRDNLIIGGLFDTTFRAMGAGYRTLVKPAAALAKNAAIELGERLGVGANLPAVVAKAAEERGGITKILGMATQSRASGRIAELHNLIETEGDVLRKFLPEELIPKIDPVTGKAIGGVKSYDDFAKALETKISEAIERKEKALGHLDATMKQKKKQMSVSDIDFSDLEAQAMAHPPSIEGLEAAKLTNNEIILTKQNLEYGISRDSLTAQAREYKVQRDELLSQAENFKAGKIPEMKLNPEVANPETARGLIDDEISTLHGKINESEDLLNQVANDIDIPEKEKATIAHNIVSMKRQRDSLIGSRNAITPGSVDPKRLPGDLPTEEIQADLYRQVSDLDARISVINSRLAEPKITLTSKEVLNEIREIDRKLEQLGAYKPESATAPILKPGEDYVLSARINNLLDIRTKLKTYVKNQADILGAKVPGTHIPLSEYVDSEDLAAQALITWKNSALVAAKDIANDTRMGMAGAINKVNNSGFNAGPLGAIKQNLINMIPAGRQRYRAMLSAMSTEEDIWKLAHEVISYKNQNMPMFAPPSTEKQLLYQTMQATLPLARNAKQYLSNPQNRLALGFVLYTMGKVESPADTEGMSEDAIAQSIKEVSAKDPTILQVPRSGLPSDVHDNGELDKNHPSYLTDVANKAKEYASGLVESAYKNLMRLYSEGKVRPTSGKVKESAPVEPTSANGSFGSPEPMPEPKSAKDEITKNLAE